MPTRVQLPNGATADFPDGMSPDDIQKAIESDPTFGVAAQKPQPSTLQQAGQAVKDFSIGALKGAGSTANNLGKILYPDFIAKHLTGAPSQQQQQGYFAPQGTAQTIGKGVEQAGEFLAPIGIEGKAATRLAEFLPKLGKLAQPAARVAASALSAGAVNKAQGGSFGTGAAMGAIGGGVAEGAKAAAPVLAESALNVTSRNRMYGRTPGAAILNDTTGFTPRAVADSAQAKMGELTPQLENAAAAAGQNGARGSLAPARSVVSSEISKNLGNRAVQSANELHPLQNFLAKDQVTGLPLAKQQTPTGLLNLKRGIDADFINRWVEGAPKGPQNTAKAAYGAVNREFERAVPSAAGLNQRVSSLFPVAERANQADLNAGILQRSFGRFGRPTGALLGAAMGGAYGYRRGGAGEAAKDATIGLFAPEFLASPTTMMMGARTLNSAIIPPVVKALGGGLLQAGRKDLYGNAQ